ncbi:hypothetical protein [Paenibacillus sp. 1011MAR3C5]|uniref:hypothetical protein n=1 Tax=Paenibacillus sp. 1011MAR3C5 TaxID=1675787 RepID=UPI001603863D|nr:hypothetical protein [Paenibacillus sp. 1011MAR3C5]
MKSLHFHQDERMRKLEKSAHVVLIFFVFYAAVRLQVMQLAGSRTPNLSGA